MMTALLLPMFLVAAPVFPQAGLTPGQTVSGRLVGAKPVSYAISLRAGEAAWLTLTQTNSDFAAQVTSPAQVATRFDAFESGPEPITLEAVEAGEYRIEIRCVRPCGAAPEFTIEVGGVHAVGQRDHDRVRAAGLCADARELGKSAKTLEASIEAARHAAQIFEDLGEPVHEASALAIAGTGHFSRNEYSLAEQNFRQAFDLPRPEEVAMDADLLTDIGLCRRYLGFPDDALKYYMQAEDKWRTKSARTEGEASTLSNIGVLLCQMGECNKAIEFHLQAIEILKRYQQPRMLALALQNLGVAYGFLGDNDSASDYIQAALPLFRIVRSRSPELARAMTNLALVRVEQRRHEEARALESEALQMTEGEERSRADVLTDLCKVEVLLGHASDAVGECREALGLYRKIKERRGEGTALHNLGVALAGVNQFDDALVALEESLEIRRAIKIPSSVIETLTRMAQVEVSRNRLEPALALAGEAVEAAESLRARITAERLRTSYFATKQSSYETYIDILMRMHVAKPGSGYDAQAFEATERRRARTLLDMLGEARNDVRRAATPDLLGEERSLIRRINYLSNQRAAAKDIDGLLRELELVEARLRERDPRLAELLNPTPPKLADIRSQLGRGDALVEYSLGADRSYAWVLTTSSMTSFVLPSREHIEHLAYQMTGMAARFRARAMNSRLEAQFQHTISALNHEVFSTLESELAGRRILLVPDGALNLVPFAVLTHLGRELVELPSAWTLATMRRGLAIDRPSRTIAVFADPVFDPADPRVTKGASRRRSATSVLPRLAFSREEARAIEHLVPEEFRRSALDFEASKKSFLSSQTADYRYLHVSSHALVDTDRPELSSIVLSQVDAQGASVDGSIRLFELYGFHTSADLVTLSACRTGVGKQTRGEGLIGLTRAFLFAGAKSVLVTLWPVEDEGTAVFMREFYQELLGSRHLKPVAALLAAQKSLARSARWRDPYHWAGFVLQGDWR